MLCLLCKDVQQRFIHSVIEHYLSFNSQNKNMFFLSSKYLVILTAEVEVVRCTNPTEDNHIVINAIISVCGHNLTLLSIDQ